MTTEQQEPLVVEEPKPEEKPAIDIDSLVSELERAGITNADELSGKLRASQETGRLAQLLGDERKRTADYEARLREMENKPAPKQQDFMDYESGQSIDIESALERSVEKALSKRENAQRVAQEQNLKKWNFIRSDKDYDIIKDVWEQKLKDPNFVYQVQAGVLDPVQDYNETKIDYYKTLLQKSHETLKTLHGTGKINPPHVESGERSSANMVSETPSGTDAEKKIAEMKAKTDKGHILTNEEELELLDVMFGKKTPL
jgi:hypothetical protein